jgi:hypothetical protein
MQRVIFQDQGQDFLEWDILEGFVVGCRPCQEDIWKGTRVHDRTINPGDLLTISTTLLRQPRTLEHPVKKVRYVRTTSGRCWSCNTRYIWADKPRLKHAYCPECGRKLAQTTHMFKSGPTRFQKPIERKGGEPGGQG